MDSRPHFTPDDCDRLERLGVTRDQIAGLEQALPMIARYGSKPPPLDDVRKPLATIRDVAAALVDAIANLENRGSDPALNDATYLLWEAHGQRLHDDRYAAPLEPMPRNPAPDKLAIEVKRLEEIASNALERIAGQQARARTASPLPISWIDEALLDGWGKTHTEQLSDEDLRNGNYPAPLPEYPFAATSTKGSTFREIVGICYEAAGHPNPDPVNAIKAFIRWRHDRFGDLFDPDDTSDAAAEQREPKRNWDTVIGPLLGR